MLNGLWQNGKTKDLPASGSSAGGLLAIAVDASSGNAATLNKNLAVRLKGAAKACFAATAASAVATFLTSNHIRLDAGERLIGLEGRRRDAANAAQNLYLEAESGAAVTNGASYWFVIG